MLCIGKKPPTVGFMVPLLVSALWSTGCHRPEQALQVSRVVEFQEMMSAEDTLASSVLDAVEVPQQLRVARGQTLFGLFEGLGLERQEANRATFAVQKFMDPRNLMAGTEFAVYRNLFDDAVSKVVFPMENKGEVSVRPDVESWQSEWREYRVEERVRSVSGRLDDSLSSSMHEAGAPYALTSALADVLQWDLDFNRDLRTGDEFSVAYRGIWVEGRFQQISSVEAASYVSRGRVLEAYQFGEEQAYYDAEGRPLRKQFLKSPLPFTRVTSRFSNSRMHPILKVRRPHYGVDYGAPTGTPVRSTASGTVTYRGRSRATGNMVRVRHSNGYQTAYLHLSKFHRNACKGCRVSQGSLVGYVGSTGLATASHLHYNVKRNGRQVDPLGLPNAPAPPLTGDQLSRFLQHRDGLRVQLGGNYRRQATKSAGYGSEVVASP